MKTLKPTIYMIYGQYGSGKTNALFKLCYQKFKENNPEEKLVLISANYCTLGQNYICEKFCEIIKIPFVSRLKEKLEEYSFEPNTIYFIDFGSSLNDQKYIYDFFNSDKFNFIISPQVLLTFCDYVSKARINDFEDYLKKLNAPIIGFNSSSNLCRGFILK